MNGLPQITRIQRSTVSAHDGITRIQPSPVTAHDGTGSHSSTQEVQITPIFQPLDQQWVAESRFTEKSIHQFLTHGVNIKYRRYCTRTRQIIAFLNTYEAYLMHHKGHRQDLPLDYEKKVGKALSSGDTPFYFNKNEKDRRKELNIYSRRKLKSDSEEIKEFCMIMDLIQQANDALQTIQIGPFVPQGSLKDAYEEAFKNAQH